MRRLVRWSGQVLLSLGAVLGTACIVLAVVGAAYDVKPLIFRSGSMAPAIPAGGLALARPVPVADLKVGDIVSVRSDDTRVTHRIHEIDRDGKRADLTLKGDANRVPDADPYRVAVADRVFFHVPYAGYVISYASGPVGLVITGMLASVLLWLVVRPSRPTSGRGHGGEGGGRRRAGSRKRAGAAALVVVGGIAAPISLTPVPTWAVFTDQGTVNSGSFAAHTVASQAQPTCTNVDGILVLGNLARLTWTKADARYEYTWQLINASTSAVAASGTVGTATAQGGTVTLDISSGLIGVNANYNVVVRARLISAPSWVAGSSTTTQVRRASILIIGVSFRCGWA